MQAETRSFMRATQANAVFATLATGVADRLRARCRFYDWDASQGEVRWVCGFDTTETDVDPFGAALRAERTAYPSNPWAPGRDRSDIVS